MRKPKFATSCLCALLYMAGAVSPVKSEDWPSQYLKNVSLVAYRLVLESPNKAPCAIDWEAWNTAIDFVANQSTKLKLIRETDHWERGKQLSDKASDVGRKMVAPDVSGKAADTLAKAFNEATENLSKYLSAPTLSFDTTTLEQSGVCIGTISAEVRAALKPSSMISTETFVAHPYMEIWSESKLLSGPPSSFSRFVIQSSEQMMKKFVNDWALSQE
jgi:hypothetical protein